MFLSAATDSNGVSAVRFVCKTSEKVVPATVVARSELLTEVQQEQRDIKCDLNWTAASNWLSWDPWVDPGWPANDICKALQVRQAHSPRTNTTRRATAQSHHWFLQVADFMSDTELEALAAIVAERVAAHVPATPVSKPLSRSMDKLMSSFKGVLGGRRKPAWTSGRKSTSPSLTAPVDTAEELLRAIELLPEHLIALVLEPYDMHAILRIPSTAPRPKLLLSLAQQQPTHSSRSPPPSSAPSGTDADTPSDTPSTAPPDPSTPPRQSLHSQDFAQGIRALPFSHVGSHAAGYLALQLPALHAHLTPNNSPLAAPATLLTLDLSHNNLALRTPKASTPFRTPLDALAANLSTLTALHSLNISFNSIAAADSIARIAAALRPLEWLQHLDVSHNLIDSDGAAALAVNIPEATALTSLNMRANRIGSVGAKAVSAALFLPATHLQCHPSVRPLTPTTTSPSPAPPATPGLPPHPSDRPAASEVDPGDLPESPTTPPAATPAPDVFPSVDDVGAGRNESPMEMLDVSHNDIEPPGLLEVAVTLAQARGRACHLSHLDLSYNCRAAHSRLVRSLRGSGSFSPRESAAARAYARAPAADGLSLLPPGVLTDASGYGGTAGIDTLEALIAMAPFLVAENLPALRALRMSAFVARSDVDASEDSILTRDAMATPGDFGGSGIIGVAPRWGAMTPAAPPTAGGSAAAGGLARSGSRAQEIAAAAAAAPGGSSSVSGNGHGVAGLGALGASLATFASTMQLLDLRGLPLFSAGGAQGITRGLSALTRLTRLDLSATDVGSALCGGGGLVAFSQLTGGEAEGARGAEARDLGPGTAFLSHMTALKRLDLCECGIDGDRVEIEVLDGFARHLCGLVELEELSLAGNGLKGGLVPMMSHLAGLTGLRTLSIADNAVTATHFSGFADDLAQLERLTRLDMSGNRVGGARRVADSAIDTVTACVSHLTALRELHVSYNRLRQVEADVLLPCLQTMPALQRVFMKQHERLDAAEARKFLGEKEEWVV